MPSTKSSLEFLGLVEILLEGNEATVKCTQIIQPGRGRFRLGPCDNSTTAERKHVNKVLKDLYKLLDRHAGGTLPNDDVLEMIEALLDICLCNRQHKMNAENAQDQWMRELSDDRMRMKLHRELRIKFSTQKEERPICSTPSPQLPPSLPTTEPRTRSATPSKFKLYDESPRKSPQREKWLTAKHVTFLLLEDLGDLDKKSAFIYLISHPQETDMFKIGISEIYSKRSKQHVSCYGDGTLIKKIWIPFARRIEQVMLTEFRLKRHKLAETCPTCRTVHGEWIKSSTKAPLVTSLHKWIRFAHEEPYNKEGLFDYKVELPSPAWQGTNTVSPRSKTPKSSSKKKSEQPEDASPSPEETPSKIKPSQPGSDQLQIPQAYDTDVDDSATDTNDPEIIFIDEGVSGMSFSSSECEMDSKEKTRGSPPWLHKRS